MIRYHRPDKVTQCPKCQGLMKMGERVYMTLSFEKGDRRNRWSISAFLCRDCARKLMDEIGLEEKE